MSRIVSLLLGIEDAASLTDLRFSLAAPWLAGRQFWLVLIAITAVAGSLLFYLREQKQIGRISRTLLGLVRGALLLLLLATLAEPALKLVLVHRERPVIWLVFDGTESMAIADELTSPERRAIETSVGWHSNSTSLPTRIDYVRSLLTRSKDSWLSRLATKELDIQAYVFDGHTTSQLRKLDSPATSQQLVRSESLPKQLSTTGEVTALGAVLEELSQQGGRPPVAVVFFSDFVQNSGVAPLGGATAPVSRLRVPLYTVGVGATHALDLAVNLQADPKLKKAERSNLTVTVRQTGLNNQAATLRISARKLGGESLASIPIAQRTLTLVSEVETLNVPFMPAESGRFELAATVEPLTGETTSDNNQSLLQVNIVDDYLRLMYVAHEPTWEWRFVKEVFHRDKLVGMDGFRTFLNSSDPQVRDRNVLFLPTPTPKRSDFFATDVLIVDDLPRAMLTERFNALVKEYVGDLGGGLVVLAGPRFGPQQIYQSALADMLPVIVSPEQKLRAAPAVPEFPLRLTPEHARYSFMQLDVEGHANRAAWSNLGKLPWYQPVSMVHPQAEVLAEHPTDRCNDDRTPQPLIAIRKYGKGEVVYIAFNELWRFRRQFGERYYRQFWSQLIYRLGMSHALGPDKRFVARIDKQQYRSGEKVALTVEAYDENYEPLGEGSVASRGLTAELSLPADGGAKTQPWNVPLSRRAHFETTIPVEAAGSYSLRIKDPIADRTVELRFEVTGLSAERQRVVRDEKLQTALAEATGGRTYDLATINRLPDELNLRPQQRRVERTISLWTTPLWFGLVIMLMLGEWSARKWVRLP